MARERNVCAGFTDVSIDRNDGLTVFSAIRP
jgi:hypothetical protein